METSAELSRQEIVDGVRLGVRKVKGAALAAQVDEHTMIWPDAQLPGASLAFDSLDLLEIVVFLEEEFGWRIPDEDIDAVECQTIGDLVTLVQRSAARNR
jgi:acyl carrier protein